MRRLLFATALIAATACKKQVVETGPPPMQGIEHPDLDCPPGTIGLGAAPPNGLEVYCARVDPSTRRAVRQGPSISWYNATRRQSRGSWVDDRRSGQWIFWNASGGVERQGSYIADRQDGLWVSFHGNGEKAAEGTFVGGKEEGRWTFWSEDGATRSEGAYESGERVGTWLDYDADGEPIRERKYRGGNIYFQRELSGVE